MAADLTGQSVRDLQEMLLFISFGHPAMPRIIPDGVFGENTLEAVMVFQRDFHPPVTGVVDLDTWEAVRAAYRDARRRYGYPTPLRVLRNGRSSFREGDRQGQVALIQTMFDTLGEKLRGFEPTAGERGVFREATRRNTLLLQKAAGQEETGVLDRAAWDTLARLYAVFVTREA